MNKLIEVIDESAGEKMLKSVNIWHSYGQNVGSCRCIFFDFQQCGDREQKVHETTTFLPA